MEKDKIEKINEIINKSKYIVFFGGAGVSTESGIPDFRSKDGLYNEKYDFSPEYMLSHNCFIDYPEEFYKFYFDKMIYKDALPNDCHKTLHKLEEKGLLKCIITQNIDGLHQKAKAKNVIELHGNVNRLKCTMCNKLYNLSDIKNGAVPYCNCGGILKPDVVLYGESLNETLKEVMKYHNSDEYSEDELDDYINTIKKYSIEKRINTLKKEMNETLDVNKKIEIAKKIEETKKEVLKW